MAGKAPRGVPGPALIGPLSALGFFAIFSTTVSKSPVLPLFVAALGGKPDIVGLVSAVSPIAGIVFSFPVGLLADRIGKRRLLLASALVFSVAPLLYMAVSEPLWLVPIRFFHGLGTAILGPLSSALIVAAYPAAKGEKLGIYSSATLVGRSLAPLAGGALISLLAGPGGAWNYRLVYALAFALSLPVLALAFRMPRDETAAPGLKRLSPRDLGSSLAAFAGNRLLLGTALVEMATYFAYGGLETFLPACLMARGVPAYQTGLALSAQVLAVALTKPLFGRLADRVDKRGQVLAGIAVLGLSFAAIPVAAAMEGGAGLAAAIALVLVFGLALSLSTIATSSYVAEVAAGSELGASLGALSSIMDVGHSSGPFVIGLVVGASGMGPGFLTGGLACAAAGLAFLALAFRPARPAQ